MTEQGPRRAEGWRIAAVAGALATALLGWAPEAAASLDGSALLPSHPTTLGISLERWQTSVEPRSAVLASWQSSWRDADAGLTLGLDAGAFGSGEALPQHALGLAWGARIGAVYALHGWNAVWPGELLLTAEAELRSDRAHPWLQGPRLAPRIGLRLLCGHAMGAVLRVDAEVAPVVYGAAAAGEAPLVTAARLRVWAGLHRLQLMLGFEQQWDRSRGTSAVQLSAGLQLGFGGRR